MSYTYRVSIEIYDKIEDGDLLITELITKAHGNIYTEPFFELKVTADSPRELVDFAVIKQLVDASKHLSFTGTTFVAYLVGEESGDNARIYFQEGRSQFIEPLWPDPSRLWLQYGQKKEPLRFDS
jgi:hypothetical protein